MPRALRLKGSRDEVASWLKACVLTSKGLAQIPALPRGNFVDFGQGPLASLTLSVRPQYSYLLGVIWGVKEIIPESGL